MHPLLRAQVAQAARRMHARGWVANHDGNVSARIGRDRIVITPTATSKSEVDEASLVVIDLQGRVVEGVRKPPGETELHLAAYRARPDVGAVLHAHPPYATAFGVARVPLEPVCLPEAVVSLGRIPLAPFAMPKSPLATEAVSRCAAEAEAMLLPGNGALTLGPDVQLCLLRMELVEHLATVLHHARALGGALPLSEEEMAALARQHQDAFPRGKA
ncbi:MAG TPA: class II aldolase/adducin family protein [Myxococcales bacterium]|nr:class II aldolase/adducin family protein [Myxococcales bacterium]